MSNSIEINFDAIEGFEWDKGNLEKNKLTHDVDTKECEEIFQNKPVFLPDKKHSEMEERYYAFGMTKKEKFLLIVFTLRDNKIRVISARQQSKKERLYYKTNKEKI